MTQYQKGMLVVNYLDGLGVHPITVTVAVSDENLDRSYQLIKEKPNISKEEFLKEMEIVEEED